jgi:hypothetical protein
MIQNNLPIDAKALNSLIGQVKKQEYELVTLLKEKTQPAAPKISHEELKTQELINAIVNKPVTIQCWH